jgi:glucokinase
MTRILAADIGGTKTLLQLGEVRGNRYRVSYERRYDSQAFPTFDDVLSNFLDAAALQSIQSACFAVAGPIANNGSSANVTNLPWTLDCRKLMKRFNINRLTLVNDFHAVAVGIETLSESDVLTLQQGQPQKHGAQLVVGAGTGLGVAQRFWSGYAYQVQAAEAGHAGFAPATEQQRQLLGFLAKDHPCVSREHVLSGQGMVMIYRFLCQQGKQMCQTLIDPAQISLIANRPDADEHRVCQETLALFFEIYGSECGNLALTTLPYGGVYIAGGIAAKNLEAMKASTFVDAFRNKNKMGKLLMTIPIHVIRDEMIGLNGALYLASQAV